MFLLTEQFINEDESKASIVTTFITITIVFVGMAFAALLLWSYQRADALFIAVFSGITLIYATTMVIFIAIIRSKLTALQFKIFMTVSIFMAIFTIILFIFFMIKAVHILKNNSSSRPFVSIEKPVAAQPPPVSPNLINYMQTDDRYDRQRTDSSTDLY